MSPLLSLRNSVQALVESLSVRLQLDVEIIDRRLNRLGASGPLRPYAGTRQARGFIYRHVLETGKPVLVSHPGREKLCQPCDVKEKCLYRAGLACPIVHEGHVVGVFTMMGLSDSQRAMIQRGGRHLLELISHLSSSLVAGQLLADGSGGSSPADVAAEAAASDSLVAALGGTRHRPAPPPPASPCANDPFATIIGESPALRLAIQRARRVAAGSATVLLCGETGTGKELFARAIHAASPVADGPFVAINCAAIPESLLESELFGYEEGAFTGARRGGKLGKFELADGGTLFLDEVGELPLGLQPKLLRALELKSVDRVGGTGSRPANIRVIAASNRNLSERVKQGEFRADLYYRLKGIPLTIPPLRERRQDIMLLAHHFLTQIEWRRDWPLWRWSKHAVDALLAYDWPGNVRELKNAVEYAATMEEGDEVTPDSLPDEIQGSGAWSLRERLESYERELLSMALTRQGQNVEGKRQVADSMGVSLPTLYRRLKELGLSS